MKNKYFLFHLKSSFPCQDIQFFVFLIFPLFLPVSHCFREWSNINLKFYDAINCLNKNSIRHLFDILRRNKVWYWNFVHRWCIRSRTFSKKNHTENVQQKLVIELFIILVNNPKQPLHARNFLKVRYFEKGSSKSLKKVTLFFLSSPVSFNRKNYQKKGGLELVTSRYLGYEAVFELF